MPDTTPIAEAVVDGVAPDKSGFRGEQDEYLIHAYADADEVAGRDLSAQFTLYVRGLNAYYDRDPTDTTSEPDGDTILQDGAGNLWKKQTLAGAVLSVNGEEPDEGGAVVLDPDDFDDSGTTNKFTTADEIAKLAGIEDNATADQTGAEIKAAYEAEADTNAYTDAEKAKVGHLAVTGAVDLDAINSRVVDLDAAVVLRGSWDASSGSFPGSGAAQAGDSYIVSVGGAVDSVDFAANDRVIAITDNASTGTYASNWLKLDYTDQVLAVVGLTGSIGKAALLAALNVEDGATADQSAAEILAALLTVDGASSGLDADKLDGNEASAFATAAQGTTADSAMQDLVDDASPQLGGALDVNGQEIQSSGNVVVQVGDNAGTNKLSLQDSDSAEVAAIDSDGNLTLSGTVDGRDIASDGSKLDLIEAFADVTDAANVAAAGAVMTSRTISTTAPLAGGGDLSANRTLTISISGETEETTPGANDLFLMELSGGGFRKVRSSNLPGGGSGSGDTAGIERDIRLLALRQAADDGDRINMVDGIADPLDDASDIDTGGSTNIDTDTAGEIKPTSSESTEDGGHTALSPTSFGGLTTIDMSWAVNNSAKVSKIAVYSTTSSAMTVKIAKRNSAGNFDIVVSESLSHGGTGWETKELSTPYDVPATGDYYAGTHVVGSASYASFSRASKSGDVTGSGQTGFSEGSGAAAIMRVTYDTGFNNMDCRSNSFTADSAPDTGRLHLQVGGTDAGTLTLNTDLIGYVSRDGGTNWTAASLAAEGELADGTKLFEDTSIDISGQPSDTDVKWRVATANNIDIELMGVVAQWA